MTALRALGLSRRRLSLAVAGSLAVLTALMVVNGETLGPWEKRGLTQGLGQVQRHDRGPVQRPVGARGDTFLNAQAGQERGKGDERYLELQGVRLYEFAKDGRLESIARAGTAVHHTGGGCCTTSSAPGSTSVR